MSNDPTETPVWFITGCSSGLGRVLALLIIDRGWRVVVTARNKSALAEITVNAEEQVLALELDVSKPDQVEAAVAATKARFGRIDVLINNAGYGYQSSIEEGIDREIRDQFEANVFGLFATTRAVLPLMRAQQRGHIINITSIAGLIGNPGSGYYAASKHAVEGFSDSLIAEVGPLGIAVTCVEPGPFRTDWAGRSLRQTRTKISDYQDTVGARQDSTKGSSGSQSGDPTRAGLAMISVTEMATPPRHLLLGAWAYETAIADRRKRLEQIEQFRAMSLGADYPS
ncbi:oxidoreductase [Pseudomonas syringae group genomosp. 3]|uniref:oxidoreductase n=1 Tax=Pseudomonas syringae group genomosp. 3 TaxID=251701 RepID=UPI0005C88E1F|nr:oxidoreductase [Pseudomonas syringae group genomosp. 3]